jgi:ATP-dependent RNA helicase DBP3
MTLGRVTSLVLDEADRLLDLGFEADLKTITTQWGNGHNFLQPDVHPRVVMTTATWAAAMNALALQFVLPGCVKITVGEKDLSASKTVTQTVEVLTRKGAFRDKRLCELLHAYLEAGIPARVLVFVLFKKEASQVATMLEAKGFKAAHLHGDMSQKQRATTLQEFRDGILPVLVATDVAARGLDVPEVTHVINTSLGLSVDHYIHRIGRCGRAGRQGTAHTFVVDYDRKFASELVMVLDQSRQSIPGELYEMAEKWDRKKSKSVTRGEAAWASGRRGEEANLDEDELAKLEAREANRSTFALVSLPLNTNQQMRTIFSFT